MNDPASVPDRSGEQLAGFIVFTAALALSLCLTHIGWQNRLLDTHPFRQTQTALSTYWMLRDGVSIDYATPAMGAPWAIPMEFPVYEAAVVAVVRLTGLPLEPAGRAVALGFFYATLPAIWLLLRRLRLPPGQRWLFLSLVLTCPVYVFYSRTFLIESTALCLAAWFLFAFHAALDSGRAFALAAAALLGVATGLAKVTTFGVFLAGATAFGLVTLAREPAAWRRWFARGLVAVLPGIAAATWWVAHSDAVKRRNVVGVMMTSVEQRGWNYGPWSLRLDPVFWHQFGQHLLAAVAPVTSLAILAVLGLLFLRRAWLPAIALLAVALAGPLVFANLYFIHDYYLYSSALFFLALLALPLQAMFAHPGASGIARWGAAAAVLAAQVGGYFAAYHARQSAPVTEAPEIARALQRVTRPDDVILGFGLNWSPILPYYSERRGLMVPDRYAQDDAAVARALANLGSARVGAVVLFRLGSPGPERFARWLERLGMDETPLLQTGEYSIHVRKDSLPDALKALADFPLKDLLLYQGQLAPPGQKPPLVYWADQVADQRIFSMMSPAPRKVTVPFGLGAEMLEGRTVFTAHSTSEVEIPAPTGAHHIVAAFGLNRAVYDRSDGIEVEIVHVAPSGGRQQLYRRWLRPAVLKGDQGVQEITLETVAPLDGSVLFRILPGGGPNFDWAYWSKIEVR